MSKPKLSGMVCEGWEAEFDLMPNHVTANAAFDGAMFETYGADLDHVLVFANAKSGAMRRRVWTLVEDDDGDAVIVNGYHLVNRLGYFLTLKPAKAGCQYVVTLS
jgi:hypothetical protein